MAYRESATRTISGTNTVRIGGLIMICFYYALLLITSVHVAKNEAFSEGAKVGYFIVAGVCTLCSFFLA